MTAFETVAATVLLLFGIVVGIIAGRADEAAKVKQERATHETAQNALSFERHEKAKYKLAAEKACKACASDACKRMGLK